VSDVTERLWPYSRRAALGAVPLIWIAGALIMLALNKYFGWPDSGAVKFVVPAVALVGFLPLVLMLVDFAASSRAVLDIKGVKIDFSQEVAVSQAFGLPDNIGIPGAVVTDSSPMQIIDALEQATQSAVAVLDVKEGNAWWVTRLLALCAGAVRSGRPSAIVFIGMKENANGSFLGWADPNALLRAVIEDKTDYEITYHRAASIAAQVIAFHGMELAPTVFMPPLPPATVGQPQPVALHSDVSRYACQDAYVSRGAAAFEQILMDQLALKHENPPDRLTLGRLNHLFEHCLYRDVIDLAQPGDKQFLAVLRAKAQFIALMKQDRFLGLIKAETGQRFVLEQLFSQENKRRSGSE
jgi:hypothetical protein